MRGWPGQETGQSNAGLVRGYTQIHPEMEMKL